MEYAANPLAQSLRTYSTQDALKPLIVSGYARLAGSPVVANLLCLEDLYLGVLIAAKDMRVRLRPELKVGESFQDEKVVERAVSDGLLQNDTALLQLLVNLDSLVTRPV